MNVIRIEFGSPEAGWLAVSLLGDGGAVNLDASDVPGDSLLMLANAASNAIRGRAVSEVTWFLEPVEHRWMFQRTAGSLSIFVDEDGGDEQCIVTGPVEVVCAAIWRAFRMLEIDPAWRDGSISDGWSHVFPQREVGWLGEELRRRLLVEDAG